jgi:hypothetical protein
MWYLTTYQMKILSSHVDRYNFGIISQVEWRKQDSQFKIKIKIFLKPKCENSKEYSRITRSNDACSQVRCRKDVNNRCKRIADWLKLSWIGLNYISSSLNGYVLTYGKSHGTFAIAYISALQIQKWEILNIK